VCILFLPSSQDLARVFVLEALSFHGLIMEVDSGLLREFPLLLLDGQLLPDR
jgi:hypothetical protein